MPRYDTAGKSRQSFRQDPLLTQISVAFERDSGAFIGNILAPTVRVTTRAGRYELHGRDSFGLNPSGDVRAPGARANEIEMQFALAEDEYFCNEHALEQGIPDEEREENPGVNLDSEATENLTTKILLGKELAVRDLVSNPAVYKASHVTTLGVGEHFDEYATSDPITLFRDVFRDFHQSTGTVPNLAVIPWKVMSFLEDHPLIIDRYRAQGGVITAEQIAAVLGLRRILVPGAAMDTSNPALDQNISDIWGDNIVLGVVPARPGRRTAALAYEFHHPISRGRAGPDKTTLDKRRDDDNIRDIQRARRRYDVKLVGRDPELPGSPVIGGYLIQDILTAANS